MKDYLCPSFVKLLIVILISVNGYSQVRTGKSDPWAKTAFLYGSAPSLSEVVGFMYRKLSDTRWESVKGHRAHPTDTGFVAQVSGLIPNTNYIFKAVMGASEGSESFFRTEKDAQMPNMSFDEWSMSRKTWFPDSDMDANLWWDSGNRGANALGQRNPTSPEENFVIKGKAVKMETMSVVGVMAGGNIFSGEFTDMALLPRPGAKVDFGRPFDSRPTKLHGYYCFEPKPINKVKEPYRELEGHPDRCRIFIMMFDTDTPYKVNTSDRVYLPPFNDPRIVGYADLVDSVGTAGAYREFTIDITYKDHRKPKYCAVVAVASYYADYFTGGVGTLLYVDEFSFIYDEKIKWEKFPIR